MKPKQKKKKRLRLKKKVLFAFLGCLLGIFSACFFIKLIFLNILPVIYLVALFFLLVVINGIIDLGLLKGKYKGRMVATIFSFAFLFFFHIGIFYETVTLDVLGSFSFLNIQTEVFHVVTLKEYTYNSIKDIEHKTIAYVDNREGIQKVTDELKKKIQYEPKTISSTYELINDLIHGEVDAIVLLEEEQNIYAEIQNEFQEKAKTIGEIQVSISKDNFRKNVKINEEPFNVYITGIDTYGDINKVARSDVNIIATVNPKTHHILLTSIPRDYYVQLHNTTGLKDKITHAGLQGVDYTVKTIEDLLKIDINYYVKINFTSLVDIVDTLGGIDVQSPFEFTANYQEEDGSYIYYEFGEGTIHLDGKKALAYSRERYGLREGDVGRARHQQQVIKAMIDKLISPDIIIKYASFMESVKGGLVTNMEVADITGFLQKQIEEMPSWTVDSFVLTGSDSSELTHTFPEGYGYVMLPDEQVVEEAIEKINDVMMES